MNNTDYTNHTKDHCDHNCEHDCDHNCKHDCEHNCKHDCEYLQTDSSEEYFHLVNSKDELFNLVMKINSKGTINMTEYNIPVSNKYFVSVMNNSDPVVNNFFEYIKDNSRSVDPPFKIDKETDTFVSLDYEQFYIVDLENTNVISLSDELDQLKNVVNESVGELILILDINYLINFIKMHKNYGNEIHISDLLIFKLKKNNISNIIVLSEQESEPEHNPILTTNLFYEQLKINLIKNYEEKCNIDTLITFGKKILVGKKISDSEFDVELYWEILNKDAVKQIRDETINMIQIKSPITNMNFYFTKIDDQEYYVAEPKIIDFIKSNIFELELKPGIVVTPLDQIIYPFDLE